MLHFSIPSALLMFLHSLEIGIYLIFSILINTSNHVMFTGKAWGLLSVAVRLCNDVNEGARINSHSYWFISVFDYDDYFIEQGQLCLTPINPRSPRPALISN